jgi:hypothetical protein
MKTKTLILFFSVLLGLSYTSLSQTRSATIATNVGTICYNTVPPANFYIAIGALCNGFSANRNGTHWEKSTNGFSTWVQCPHSVDTRSFWKESQALTVTTQYRMYSYFVDCGVKYSNVITITVLPPVTAGSILGTQNVCYGGTPTTFYNAGGATGANGAFTYDWQSTINGGASWTSCSGGTGLTYCEPAGIIQEKIFKRVATSTFGCDAVQTNVVTISVYNPLTSGSIGENQSICYNSVPAAFYNVSLPTGDNGSYTYVWRKSINGGSSYIDIGSSNSSDYSEPNPITQTTLYLRVATSGSCGSLASIPITVTVYAPLTGGSILGSQTIPYNTTPTAFSNSNNPAGANGSYNYTWQKSVNGGSTWSDIIGANSNSYSELANLTVTTKYKLIVTSGGCESSESNVITVNVLPQLLGGSIAGTQTICYSTNPTPITNSASPTGGNGSFTYQWKKSVNGGISWDDIPVIATDYFNCPALTQTTLFKRVATSGTSGSVESNVITITVLTPLTSGAIAASQTISYQTAPNPFTNDISPTGGTGSYTYLWKQSINGGAVWTDIDNSNANYYSSGNLTVTTLFKRVATSGSCGSVESNVITITVFSPLTGGAISEDQTICNSSVPASFSNVSIPTGGTGSFTYQWKKSVNGGSIWADIASASSTTYAETNNLTTTTQYKRVATSGSFGSIESNIVIVTVLPQILGGSISTSQTLCYGTKPATFTSVTLPSGGNETFTYQWQKSVDLGSIWVDIPVANGETYTDINNLTVTTKYKRVAIFSCGMVESNIVTAFVLHVLNGGGVTADQTLCYGLKPANFISSIDPTGSSTFSYQWQKKEDGHFTWSDITGANSLSYSEDNNLIVTTQYKRLANSGGCGTVESNIISITVYSPLTGGAITADQTICNSSIPSGFTNVNLPSGGNGSYSYLWKKSVNGGFTWADISGANSSTFSESLNLNNSTIYKRIATSGTCGSTESNVIAITVLPDFVSGVISSTQTVCYLGNPLPLTGTNPTGADGSYTFQWQSSGDNTNWSNIFGEKDATLQPQPSIASTYFRRIASNAFCNASVISNPLLITVRDKVTKPSVSISDFYCKNTNVTLNIANPNSSTYKWYNSFNIFLSEGSQISFSNLTADFSVYVKSILSNGCASEPLDLQVKIDPIKANFTSDITTVTLGDPIKFTSTSVNASTYTWNFFEGDIINEMNPVHYYNTLGVNSKKFSVELTIKSVAGCSDSVLKEEIISVINDVTGIEKNKEVTFTYYPNPVKEKLSIISSRKIETVKIFNSGGKMIESLVFDNDFVFVDFSSFKTGIYFLEINGLLDSKKNIKIIKQ